MDLAVADILLRVRVQPQAEPDNYTGPPDAVPKMDRGPAQLPGCSQIDLRSRPRAHLKHCVLFAGKVRLTAQHELEAQELLERPEGTACLRPSL